MKIRKRIIRGLLATLPAFLLLQQTAIRSSAKVISNNEKIVRISASTFEFKPSEITVKKGVPVTLEIISQDRHHGFKLPEFHLRADIKAGAVEMIKFTPDKTGTFTFFCDVFCGDGHEDMSGTLKVVEQ
jgi:cytochrome c oxidase subunit II